MNNDDLISRQAAIELIKNKSYTIKHNHNDVEKDMTLYDIIQALEYLPSVQQSNYCPNCGADMRSKAREYLEYGELITKGIADGLRGDSDE